MTKNVRNTFVCNIWKKFKIRSKNYIHKKQDTLNIGYNNNLWLKIIHFNCSFFHWFLFIVSHSTGIVKIQRHDVQPGERDGLSVHEEAQWGHRLLSPHRGADSEDCGHAGWEETA